LLFTKLLNRKLEQIPFIRWQKVLSVHCKHHLEHKQSKPQCSDVEITVYAESKCSQLVDMLTKSMKSKLNSLLSSKRPIHFEVMLEEFRKQIKNLLEKVDRMNTDQSQTFYFKTELIVDVVLTASKCAEKILLDTVEQSKKGDATCALEKEKDAYYRKLHFLYTTQKDTQEENIRRQQREIEIKVQELVDTIESKLKVLASDLVTGNNDKRLSDDDLKKNFDERWNIWLDSIPSITVKSSGEQSKKGDAKCALEKEKDAYYRKLRFLYTTQKCNQEENIRRQQEEIGNKKKNLEQEKKDLKQKEKDLKQKNIEVKSLEEKVVEKTTKVQCAIQAKEKEIRKRAKEKAHENVIELFCDIIKCAIDQKLKQSIKFEVYEDMTKPGSHFEDKENFKCLESKEKFKFKVLQHLLDHNFEQYKQYLTYSESSFKEWMCKFVNTHCNQFEGNVRIFQKLANAKLHNLFKSVESAIEMTDSLNYESWINKFYMTIQSLLPVKQSDVQFILDQDITWDDESDPKAFKTIFKKYIVTVKEIDTGVELYNVVEKELYDYMWDNLKERVLGCTACCPFCKEMCDSATVCGQDMPHLIKLHRPQCLGRYTWVETKLLVVDVCTTSIGSECRFRNQDTKGEWVFYKDYQKLYPDWLIETSTEEVPAYWKYVVKKFSKEISEWSNGKDDSIPKEWYETSLKDAQDSLLSCCN